MINKDTQQHLNRIISNMMEVYFVFKSKVHYDMYLMVDDGLRKYDSLSHQWIKSGFENKDELVSEFKDKYPVYSNREIGNNLDWDFDDNVESLTNRSFAEL